MNYKIYYTKYVDVCGIYDHSLVCFYPTDRYNFKNYQYILALLFAIEEINGNHNLLPHISLGFDFYNVRFTEKETLDNAVIWLSALVQRKFLPNYNCKREISLLHSQEHHG